MIRTNDQEKSRYASLKSGRRQSFCTIVQVVLHAVACLAKDCYVNATHICYSLSAALTPANALLIGWTCPAYV
jgi:hypothetical protein